MTKETWIRPGLRGSWPWAQRLFWFEYRLRCSLIWPIFGEQGYLLWNAIFGRRWPFTWARRTFRQVWLCYREARLIGRGPRPVWQGGIDG